MAGQSMASATEYIPPSVSDHILSLCSGASYTHHSTVPTCIKLNDTSSPQTRAGTPVILGVDEAGRGPVLGPMVYGIFYLPLSTHPTLLSTPPYQFDDSKKLDPLTRARLMRDVCTPSSALFTECGWAVRSLSAQDIGAGMLRAGGAYNLNAQAMDATIGLIRGVIEQGVNVVEIFVDTIGHPGTYQRKLAAMFPGVGRVVVEKKADSLYPVVSAASVVAKVTRDVSCEVLWKEWKSGKEEDFEDEGLIEVEETDGKGVVGWGSGYPSDARCVSWLKGNTDGMFGWGNEVRFSWATVKDMLEDKGRAVAVEWAEEDEENNVKLSQYFGASGVGSAKTEEQELRGWYGNGVGKDVF